MIDFSNLDQYRENNRIEAKKALGGLPKSIWETYSAFANALGGLILLGVVENADKSLSAVDLPDPEGLISDFWEIVNDPERTSVNILSRSDITVQQVDGKQIVVIDVPRAERTDRPVYVDGSPRNTFCRNGEGDCRCTEDEYQAMVRDAAVKTQDMRLLERLSPEALSPESVHDYRGQMWYSRPDHVWQVLDDEAFLLELGALGTDADGKPHPTAAGLLMFGTAAEIAREYPAYSLDYRDQSAGAETVRITTEDGGWSGNIYDFYSRVCETLTQNIPAADSDGAVRRALREALANCLMNADYYGRQGIMIRKDAEHISFTNPGSFRIRMETARRGGISDARNSVLQKMFHLVDVGERSGSGIPRLFRTWHEQRWSEPILAEEQEPPRITVTLWFGTHDAQKPTGEQPVLRVIRQQEEIISYLTDHAHAGEDELTVLLGADHAQIRPLLRYMEETGILEAQGSGDARMYRLKA